MFIQPQIAEGVVSVLIVLGNGAMSVFAEPLEVVSRFIDGEEAPSADDVAEMARMFYEFGGEANNLGAFTSIDVVVRSKEDEDEEQLSGYNLASLFFPGLIMFGLFSMSLNLESRLLRDRIDHVTHRMVMSPTHPVSIVLQQRIYSASFLYIAAVVSALLGGIIWRIPAVGLAQASVISLALVLFITGLNGTIFGLSSSRRATSAISSTVMMGLLIIGGSFFPAEFTSPGFQALSKMTPTGMANVALTRTVTGRELGVSIPLLFAYCGLFFAISLVVGRRRLI